MTRRPLRPISQIISARKNGQNPDHIERENIRQRHESKKLQGLEVKADY